MVSRIARWTVFVLPLGVLVYVVLLAVPGIRDATAALRHASRLAVLAALVAEVAANACLAQVYRQALRSLGGSIGYRDSLRISMATFTIGHVLPAGGAVGGIYAARELVSHGAAPATATGAVLLAGATAMGTLGVIVVAGTASALFRGDLTSSDVFGIGGALTFLGVVGAAVWLAVRSARFRGRVFDLAQSVVGKAGPVDLGVWRGSVEAVVHRLPGGRRLLGIASWSAANWLLDAAALWLLFRSFGYPLHFGLLIVGYGLANLLTALPVVPGGLGLVEAGLAGIYTAFGVPGSVAVVAVLAYRLLSYWLPILAGVPAYLRSTPGRAALPSYLAAEEDR